MRYVCQATGMLTMDAQIKRRSGHSDGHTLTTVLVQLTLLADAQRGRPPEHIQSPCFAITCRIQTGDGCGLIRE